MISPFFFSVLAELDFVLSRVLKLASVYDFKELFLWYYMLLVNFYNGASFKNGISDLRGKVDLLEGESVESGVKSPKIYDLERFVDF